MSDQVRSKTKRVIVWFVTGAHVLLILVPGIVYFLSEWLKPAKPVIHKIVLTDKIPGQGDAPDADPGGQPQPEQDLPPDPGEVTDIPDMPKPKPQTKPVPPKPVTKPQPKPVTPKPVTKPQTKPVPSKPKSKPKPQKTKRPTVEDIRSKIQRGSRTQKNVKKVVKSGTNTNSNKRNNALSNIANEIRAGTNSHSSGNSIGSGVAFSYYDTVGSFLERLWKQDRPNSSALGGKRPVVVVEFRIDANGVILSKRIISKSGIPVVDSSVERLLARISALPQPPAGAKISQFTVNMRVNE